MARFCTECGHSLKPRAAFCTQCGHVVPSEDRFGRRWSSKRAQFAGKQSRRSRPLLWSTAAILTVAVLYAWWPRSGHSVISDQPIVSAELSYGAARIAMKDISATVQDGRISIPVSVLKDRKLVAFEYRVAGKQVPLLAYLSSEGRVVTAVSMCEPCDSRRFHIDRGQLVCDACGSSWKLDNLESLSGSCGAYPPDAIPSVVEDGQVLIDESLVRQWRRRI